MKKRPLTPKITSLVLAAFATFGFVWGYITEHTVLAAIILAVAGLFEAAFQIFMEWFFASDKGESRTTVDR